MVDPATQMAREETDGLPQGVKDKLKREIRKAHHDPRHPSKTALMRLARLAKKGPDHLYYIKHWQCPVCLQRKAPPITQKTSAIPRPEQFDRLVGFDLKYKRDVNGQQLVLMNILDVATRYSAATDLKNKEPAVVAKALWTNWWSTFGAPIEVIHDQGREFSQEFQAHLERCGASFRLTLA